MVTRERAARIMAVVRREWSIFQCANSCHVSCSHSVFTDPRVVRYL